MIVFKNFLRILKANKKIMIFIFGLFALISILMAMKENPVEKYTSKKEKIAIIDESQSLLSQHLSRYLAEVNQLTTSPAKKDIEESVYANVLDAVIIIPKNFEINPEANKIIIHSNFMGAADQKIANDITGYMLLWQIAHSDNGEIDYALLDQAFEEKAEVEIVGQVQENNSTMEWVKYYMNASSYIVIAMITSVIGMVMLDFNQNRIRFRINCSGYSLRRYQAQMLLGQMVFGGFVWLIVELLAFILNPNKNWHGDYLQYGVNLAVYITTIMGLTFLLTNLIKSKNGMSAISNIIALGSSFISGVFIPLEILSPSVIRIAQFFPAYYFVSANESIFIHSDKWIMNIGIQLLFGLVFFLVGIYIAKIHQSEQALEW